MLAKTFWTILLGLAIVALPGSVFAAEEEGKGHGDEAAAAGHDDEHHGDGEHHGHIGDPVKPETKKPEEFRTDLAIFSFIVFMLLMTLLGTFAWKPITQALDEREAKVRGQLAETEANQAKAAQLLQEHTAKLEAAQEEVREIIAEARRDAEHTKDTIISEARAEAEALKDRAIDDIQRATDAALTELFSHMSANVAEATEHVLGRAITGDDQGRLIDEALAQISES